MFIAALPTTDEAWKQVICLSTDEWTERRWSMQTVENSLVLKREKPYE